jgi:hypothetical protein
LTRVYKYSGPTYDFEFARDVLVALDNIINAGLLNTQRPFALYFDVECVDKLSGLLRDISENPHKGVKSLKTFLNFSR